MLDVIDAGTDLVANDNKVTDLMGITTIFILEAMVARTETNTVHVEDISMSREDSACLPCRIRVAMDSNTCHGLGYDTQDRK